MLNRTSRFAFLVLYFLLAAALTTAQPANAQPNAPSGALAFPSYDAAPAIVLRWQDNAGDETGFEVERSTGAAWALVASPGASPGTGTVEWRDTTVALDTDYSYRVRAVNASGGSVWVGPTDDTQRPTNNAWPRSDGVRDIMNIWSGSATGNGQRFHEGIDFHAIEPVPAVPPAVQAIRGGTLATTAFSGPGLTIAVEVEVSPGTYQYDYYLHLQDVTVKAVGDPIAPAEYLGRISTTAYGVGWRHTHIMNMAANDLGGAGWPNCRSPWSNFATAADLDPFGTNPHLLDQSGDAAGGAPDGRVVFAVDAAAPATVVDPLRGDVDLLIEAYDDMNSSLGYENNISGLAYWVEPPAGATGLGSAAAPLRLFSFDDTWFADFTPISAKFWEVFEQTRIHPGSEFVPGFFMKRGHHIATSATTTSGDPGDVDGARFWRTRARNIGGTAPYYHDSLEARYNGEARFPDGVYTVHALMSDQVHIDVEEIQDITLDNWLPQVQSVHTASASGTLSHATWALNGGTGLMDATYPGGPTDIVMAGIPQDDIVFTITFSEAMATATLNVPGVSWAAPSVTLTPNADATVWTGTLPGGAPPGGTDPSGLYFLHVDGTDLAGNVLAGRSNFATFNPATALDPDTGATGTDNVHRFSIATQRDIVLLLDRSGSMAGSAPGFSSKMAALKDAGNIFLDILTPSTATELAAVKYDDVIELLCPACTMGQASSAHIGDIRTGITGLTPRNMTSIGGGLVEAANQLSGAGDEKNLVLLFTDGKHNSPPSVSDGLAAIHALSPDNTTVSAIGFGSGSSINVPQLQTIVTSTNGELWTTSSGLELHKFFVEALMNAGGTPYSVFITDPTSSINRGQIKEHSYTIDTTDRQIAVIVEWGDTSGAMAVSLISPNNTRIDATDAAANPHITFTGGSSYAMYQLSFPLGTSGDGALAGQWQGTWRISLNAEDMSAGQHDYAYSVVSSSDLSLDARVVGGRFAGDRMYLVARLLHKGKPVTGRVSAWIDYPLVSTPNVVASSRLPVATVDRFRDLLTAKPVADRPLTAPGVYEFALAQQRIDLQYPRSRQRYPLTARAPAAELKLKPGELVLELPDTKVAGDYRITLAANAAGGETHSPRYTFMTHNLRPRLDANATAVRVFAERNYRFLERRKLYPVVIEVMPQDRFGNLIGTGLLEDKALSAKIEGGELTGVHDQGDGRYLLRVMPASLKAGFDVRLDIQGEALAFSVSPEGKLERRSRSVKQQ